MAQAILKLTSQEAVIKVWPSEGDTETSNVIDLTGLVAHSQEVVEGEDQVVNIAGVTWLGEPTAVITITRGDETVMTLPCTGANEMDFTGQDVPPDTVENTEDIEVTFAGTGQLYIKLRKVSGYQNQVENEKYGAYDDPTRVGASTTMSGSPDRE